MSKPSLLKWPKCKACQKMVKAGAHPFTANNAHKDAMKFKESHTFSPPGSLAGEIGEAVGRVGQ